jgi:hypothetical protein
MKSIEKDAILNCKTVNGENGPNPHPNKRRTQNEIY